MGKRKGGGEGVTYTNTEYSSLQPLDEECSALHTRSRLSSVPSSAIPAKNVEFLLTEYFARPPKTYLPTKCFLRPPKAL